LKGQRRRAKIHTASTSGGTAVTVRQRAVRVQPAAAVHLLAAPAPWQPGSSSSPPPPSDDLAVRGPCFDSPATAAAAAAAAVDEDVVPAAHHQTINNHDSPADQLPAIAEHSSCS